MINKTEIQKDKNVP